MKYSKILLLTILSACSDKNNTAETPHLKIIDFKTFTIDAPDHWTSIQTEGIDSYVRRIAIGQGDTLVFDYGYYSNSLTEYDPTILPTSFIGEMLKEKRDTAGYIFSDKPDTINIDKIKKQNVMFDTISGFEAKIIFPRQSGRGLTGVHFKNLGNDSSGIGNKRLTLTGKNLKQTNELDLLNSIKTIKILPVTARH